MENESEPRMRKLEVEVIEAANFRGSGSWKPLKGSASTLTIHIERQNLNVVQCFAKNEKGMFDQSLFAKKHF